MNRRDFIKLTGAASIGAVAEQPAPTMGSADKAHPRQAIVILGESVRYDMLNCNAKTGLRTPNLDRIAAQGVRFERAYNCQPVWAPARSALWTGLCPHTNGVWGNSMPLGYTAHTIGQRLTDKGIHCAFMGKWHLSGTDYLTRDVPLQDGTMITGTICAITSTSFLQPTACAPAKAPRATIPPGRQTIDTATALPTARWIFSPSTRTKTFSW